MGHRALFSGGLVDFGGAVFSGGTVDLLTAKRLTAKPWPYLPMPDGKPPAGVVPPVPPFEVKKGEL